MFKTSILQETLVINFEITKMLHAIFGLIKKKKTNKLIDHKQKKFTNNNNIECN